MKRILILPSFERSVKKLTPHERGKLVESLKAFNLYLLTGEVPVGFGFKKINYDKYEFRIDIRLRVVVKVAGDDYYLILAGSHDEIKKYLRHFR